MLFLLYLVCSYPLCFIGARDGLLDLFKTPQAKRTDALFNKITVGMIAAITAMAAKLTDLGLVAGVGGATFGTALVFVYPTIMLRKVKKNKGSYTDLGTSHSDDSGKMSLPVFTASRTGTYTFAMINPESGGTLYVKVKVAKRS